MATEDADAELSLPHPISGSWSPVTSPTVTLVETIAEAIGRETEAMPPLADAIDPDALDALLSRRYGENGNGLSVSFNYDGLRVTLDTDGYLYVQSRTGTDG
ncbi:HalOD1 output domain-containing protein [Haloarcula marina]|uniref:HalOD1 output domain-containing protein n=1 Tax=Haloarcula marina TaxID=2961574 RepID=UPI0020B8B00C|nr:HalOD1 output domain-containing protein [Halomicroarcula marina]